MVKMHIIFHFCCKMMVKMHIKFYKKFEKLKLLWDVHWFCTVNFVGLHVPRFFAYFGKSNLSVFVLKHWKTTCHKYIFFTQFNKFITIVKFINIFNLCYIFWEIFFNEISKKLVYNKHYSLILGIFRISPKNYDGLYLNSFRVIGIQMETICAPLLCEKSFIYMKQNLYRTILVLKRTVAKSSNSTQIYPLIILILRHVNVTLVVSL